MSVPPPPTPRRKAPSGTGTSGTSDTPPRRAAPGGGARGERPGGSSPRKSSSVGKLQASLEELIAAPALLYAVAGDEWAVNHVTTSAPAVAEAWAKLAQESPAVKRVLERLTTGTAWGGVIFATGGMVLPLLAHHNLLPVQIGALINGSEDGSPNGGPIVPPPPSSATDEPGVTDSPGVSGMTPPIANGQPPGVVTVAGTGAVT